MGIAEEQIKLIALLKEDIAFVRNRLMPWIGAKAVYIAWSRSKAKWPDIWVEQRNGIPMITVTQEWRSHDKHLRRSQLVHEGLHILGMEHGRIGKYDFNTHPELDSYSKYVYRSLI